MRTLRSLLVLSAVLVLALFSQAFANDFAVDAETTDVVASTDPETADGVTTAEGPALNLEPPAAFDLGPMVDLLGMTWADPKQLASFGSHCSGPPAPWNCSITESGLGCPPGGGCTYSCLCDRCTMSDGRVETVAINCQLVDDGGCLACPM